MAWWSVVFLAIFMIGLTKSGFGSGTGLMIVPMMALSLGHIPGRSADEALGLLLPLLICGDILAVWQYRKLFNRDVVGRLLPGTIAGIFLVSELLYLFGSQHKELADALIRIEIGLESLLLVTLALIRGESSEQPLTPSSTKSAAVGAFAGLSSTLAHAAGPIITLYLLPQRLERQIFVGTTAIYFFLVNTAKLPGYYYAGLFDHASPKISLLFFPIVLAGAVSGLWLNRRVGEKLFSRIILIVTLALGAYILIDGGLKLRHYLTISSSPT